MEQENISLEEVFDNLKCTRLGLNSDEARERLDLFGYNKLEEKKVRINYFVFSSVSFLSNVSFPLNDWFSFAGKQDIEVPGLHVEPFVMGHGSCSDHGHRSCSWRRKCP